MEISTADLYSVLRKQVIFLLICTVFMETLAQSAEVLRPRGVAISKLSFYNPETDFTCFDGSATIPFKFINDDYCDCSDGSDEPGTAACPNGTFHCTNAGHKPQLIPSSRVNDGICDCCDTSDEYATSVQCVNNCKELGKVARLEAQKQVELMRQGYDKRQELSKHGQRAKQEKKDKLTQLEKEKQEAENLKAEKESLKQRAEEPEKLALEKYQEVEEQRKQQKQEREQLEREQEARETFDMLDTNNDEKVDLSEVITRQTFDQNKDGSVSDEEATYFLGQTGEMSWDEFKTTGWIKMKPFFMMDKGMFTPPTTEAPPSSSEEAEGEDERETGEQDENGDEEEDYDQEDDSRDAEQPAYEGGGESETADEEEEPIQYDPETQALIDAASKARSEFDEADRGLRDINRELKQLTESLEKDYGPEEEFGALDGECFELSEREYTYKICPFDQVVQKPRHGGAEIRLGAWGHWAGPDGDPYSRMKFENGQTCWNGPQRTATVDVRCGMENEVISAAEPNRCEYHFVFTTPAVCTLPKEVTEESYHDEL